MKSLFGIIIYFILSGSFLFKKNNGGLSLKNTTEIKGISAVLIILTHCISAFGSDNYFLNQFCLGWLVVAVFFFLSGYGIAHGYKCKENYFNGFLKTRFTKLLIPYLIANIIYIPVKIANGTDFTPKYLLMCLIGQNSIVSFSWYVIAVFFMYLLFWISFRLFKRHNMLILVILMAAFTALEVLLYTEKNDYWFISNLSFVFGIAYRLYDIDKIKKYHIIPVCVVGFFGAALLIPVFNNIDLLSKLSYAAYVISSNFQSAFFVLVVISVVPIFQFNNIVSDFLGKISYEIYLYHGFFIFIFQKIAFIHSHFLLFFIAVCASTVAFSAIMNFADKKLINLLLNNNKIKKQI